jgi:farnesyl-diphosphate farnesyltransferase
MDRYQHVEGVDNLDYVELLRLTPYLFDQLAILPAAYGQEIRLHVARVIRRMQRFIKKHDDENRLHLRRLQELDDYCYAVAGIVGELITALISLYRPTLDRTRLLFMRSFETACGAGLQLTNILKDVFRDHLEGRYYIPQEYLPFQNGGGSDQILPIIAHAYRNLCLGRDYACALPEEEVDIRRAILVPFFLALATLEHLLRNLEALFQGDEVKISREKVVEILILTEQVVEENQAIEAAWDELGGGLRHIDLSSLLSQQMRLGRGV